MHRELRDKWVSELRSGTYQQGRQGLRSANNHFCCIGVLCDVYDPNSWSNGPDCYGYYKHRDDRTGYPSFATVDEIGIDPTYLDQLVQLNDYQRLNFAQIADWIEQNVPVTEN